jgi:prepilin-type N-terminal cleavage/methylation domain-containing protein
MKPEKRTKRRRGFTLVELLVVIAIIGILISLVFPAVRRATDSARRGQAATEVKSIESAVLSYYNEYGRYPHGNDPGRNDYFYGRTATANYELINVLRSIDGTGNVGFERNPRRIVFLEVPERSLSSEGDFLDPWGEPYNIYVDTSFDNTIEGGEHYPEIQNRRVAVWSVGKQNPTPQDFQQRGRHIQSWPFAP